MKNPLYFLLKSLGLAALVVVYAVGFALALYYGILWVRFLLP